MYMCIYVKNKVCKSWRSVLDNPYIWRSLCKREQVFRNKNQDIQKLQDNPSTSNKPLPPLCGWRNYFINRMRLKNNFRRGKFTSKLLNPSKVLDEECGWCFDCDGEYLSMGTNKGRILLWSLNTGEELVQQTFMLSEKISKVYLRDGCLMVLQQGVLFLLRIMRRHLDSIYTLHLGVEGTDLTVSSEFGRIGYGYKGDTFVSILDMKSGNETMLIQLEENYFLETLLLSHQETSKDVMFVSAYKDSQNNNIIRFAFFYSLQSGNRIFHFNISNTIDTVCSANLIFIKEGIFLEGKVISQDYSCDTLWKVWDSQGNERMEQIFSSDCGMILTGSHSEDNRDVFLTASGRSYLSYFSTLEDHMVFTHREDKGISLNVYEIKESDCINSQESKLQMSRLWRSMQYIENSSILGSNLPCAQVPEGDAVLSLSSDFTALVVRDRRTGHKLNQIRTQGKVSRIWCEGSIVLLLNGGPLNPPQLLNFI